MIPKIKGNVSLTRCAHARPATRKPTHSMRTIYEPWSMVCRPPLRRDRHRSPGDVVHQLALDPRRDPLPADAAGEKIGVRGWGPGAGKRTSKNRKWQ